MGANGSETKYGKDLITTETPNTSVIVGYDDEIYVNKKDSPDKKHLENEYLDKKSRKDEYFGPHI